jgi:PQQ-dependent dehydrogenase (methanol/ethanol family)
MLYMKKHLFHRMSTAFLSVTLLFHSCNSDTSKSNGTATGKSTWSYYGGDQSNQRYSSLNQINTTNVKDLGLAWEQSLNLDEAQECTPIIADGTLFVTTALGPKYVYAFDAKNGTTKWKTEFTIPADFARYACCGLVNRGASYSNGKLYIGRLDGKLSCLDAATGKELWSTVVVDYQQGAVITSPPLIVGNKIITGHGGGEFGAVSYLSAYDAETGKQLWKTLTVPGTDPKVAESWKGDSWKSGGSSPWFIGTYDPELNTVYWGTGNPSPWLATVRSVDDANYGKKTNLHSASTLAINPDDGAIKWTYQTTPADAWDYDGVNELVMADLNITGTKTPVIMKADRNGFFYCLDRRDGKLLSADTFVKTTWAKSIDLATGLPVEDPKFRVTKTNKATGIFPSVLGGKNWQPMSFNPNTGLVYIPANNVGMDLKSADVSFQRGYPYIGTELGIIYPTNPGEYIAWDPVAKKKVWSISQKFPLAGGGATTAGGLLFFGNIEGSFQAVDAKTGKILWQTKTTSGITAAPMTYQVDGKQYVAIVEGRPSVIPGFIGSIGVEMVKATPAGGKISVFALNGGK